MLYEVITRIGSANFRRRTERELIGRHGAVGVRIGDPAGRGRQAHVAEGVGADRIDFDRRTLDLV